LFNGANIILATGVSGLMYEYVGGTVGVINLNTIFVPAIVCIIVYIAANATIVSTLMSILNNQTFFKVWYDNIIWVIRNYLALAPISILMAAAYKAYGIMGVALFLGPLLLARYSFKLFIDMKNIYIETVRALSHAVEAKDKYTQGHSMRVSEYSVEIAKKLSLSQKRIDNIKIAAILHDIGKIGVEENILNKHGSLTQDEFDKIKQHPSTGVKIIQEIDFLKDVAEIILAHHEKVDGSGYPNGKRGNEICLESCILSVADVYDALTSDRPYRAAMSQEQALEIIRNGRDTQFNPLVVDAFVKVINEHKELNSIAS
jgi:putative nucleotidyltransferase with HDIG domain